MVITKRPCSNLEQTQIRPAQRIKPTPTKMTPMQILNLEDGETVHQQCLLLKGQCPSFENTDNDYVRVCTYDDMQSWSSAQNWPVVQGTWKALVVLSPGLNTINVDLHHAGAVFSSTIIQVTHQPLLQLPPLHLAIMVAKDSSLLIDCPPAKYGAFSSTHNSLDAVIGKFRTTAYMWQALTAADLHEKGLGRRSFRLEEEWTVDSTRHGSTTVGDFGAAKSLPKVHIIRSDKTMAELRNPNLAQQYRRASKGDALHAIFKTALAQHGPPFDSSCRPVVAGLILDSHYSIEDDLITGHAALGQHDRNGLSLGIFGSHLTYSWPRFLEEASDCLTDMTAPGDTVGNDNGECHEMRRACAVGQGAFLHEVGHAFGAEHTTGIMERGYSKDWEHVFMAGQSEHDCNWDLRDALRFKTMPHFRIPGDDVLTKEFLNADVKIEADSDEGEDRLVVSTSAGLARLIVSDDTNTKKYDVQTLNGCIMWGTTELSSFDRMQPLRVTALACNGKQKIVKDAWRLFTQRSYIDLPGGIRLHKHSVKSDNLAEAEDLGNYVQWTAMLAKPDASSQNIISAKSIDLRVGCWFDGAVVYYSDGSHFNCGRTQRPHAFGGHASQKRDLPSGSEIVKIQIQKASHGRLDGIRMTLANGESWGCLNDRGGEGATTLEPKEGYKIIGFFGASEHYAEEFGIITAPRDFVVDAKVLGLRELSNGAEGGEIGWEEYYDEDEDMDQYSDAEEEEYDEGSQSTLS